MQLSQDVVESSSFPDDAPPGHRHQIMDSTLKGYGLRVYPTGRKVFFVRYRTADGRRRFYQLGDAPPLKERKARKLAEGKLAEVTLGGDPAEERDETRSAPTVKELWERFRDGYAKHHRKRWREDERRFNKYILPSLGTRKAHLVTKRDMARLHTDIGQHAHREANNVLNLLRRIWNVAIEWEELPAGSDNPAAAIKRFPERSRDRWLTADEMARLLKAIDQEVDEVPKTGSISEEIVTFLQRTGRADIQSIAKAVDHPADKTTILLSSLVQHGRLERVARGVYRVDPDGARWADLRAVWVRGALWLYILTGCRKSELLRAKWEDVDWERRELSLPETKSGKPQRAPLSEPALDILRSMPRQEGNAHVFPGRREGAPLTNISKPWERIRQRAKLPDVRLHDLRRTMGSWLAQGGAPVLVIQQALHHASYEATLVYSRMSADPVRQAVDDYGDKIKAIAEDREAEVKPIRGSGT